MSIPSRGFVIPQLLWSELTEVETYLLELSEKPGNTTQKVSWWNLARIRVFRRNEESFDELLGRALDVIEWDKGKDCRDYKAKHGHYPEKVGVVRYSVWKRIIEKAKASKPDEDA